MIKLSLSIFIVFIHFIVNSNACHAQVTKTKLAIAHIANIAEEITIIRHKKGDTLCIAKNSKGYYGIINISSEKAILPFVYDNIERNADEPFFRLQDTNSLWGLLSLDGKTSIPCEYFYIPNMEYKILHLMSYKKGEKNAIADSNLKIMIPPLYENVHYINEDAFSYTLNNKRGMLNKYGEIKVPALYDRCSFDDTLPLLYVKKGELYGVINYNSGEQLVPFAQNELVGNLRNGLIRFIKDGKYGFLNLEGKEVIPAIYKMAGDFNYKNTWVQTDYHSFFIDNKGNEMNKVMYDEIETEWGNGQYMKVRKGYNDGIVNHLGQEIIPCKFKISKMLSETLFLVWAENEEGYDVGYDVGYGVINNRGKQILPNIYTSISKIDHTDNLFIRHASENKASIYNYIHIFELFNTKTRKFTELPFEEMDYDFKHHLAWFYKDGKYGFINGLGKIVSPAIYDEINFFDSGMERCEGNIYGVSQNGKWGLMDTLGKLITPLKYTSLDKCWHRTGILEVEANELHGLVNLKGEEIVPCQYISLEDHQFPYEYDGDYLARIIFTARRENFYEDLEVDGLGNELITYKYKWEASKK